MNAWKASADFERPSNEPANTLIKGVFIALGISLVLFILGTMGVLWLVDNGWIN